MSTQMFYWRQYQFYSIFINFHFITYIQLIRMTFQVKKVIVEQTNQQVTWKFKLINKKQTQYSFYELQQSSRSLLDLAKDINGQMDAVIQSKKKKNSPKNRTIRKACQNIIKGLKLSLASFCDDIGEDVSTMKRFFNKDKFSDCDYDRLIQKCKKWTMSAWEHCLNFYYNSYESYKSIFLNPFIFTSNIFQLSIAPDQFFNTTNKFLESYIKDGKKVNPDFDTLTELTAITLGDQPKFSDLSEQLSQENQILIDINLQIQQKYLSESLLYNTNNLSHIKVRNFSEHFLKDLLKENAIQLPNKDSIQQLQQEVRIQIRTQCLYKTLLKKHAPILLNFSTIQIPSEVRQYLIPIEIKLKDQYGNIAYEDYFQWDILNQNNNFNQFCQQLMEDAELDSKLYSQLCYKIRTQINSELQWKFMLLVKTFKQIHKDRESPKLNTQTIMIIKKNLSYTMDVLLPADNKSYRPSQNIYFSNSDLFSLLSRNADILPQQFQEILMCKQGKQVKDRSQQALNNNLSNLSSKIKKQKVYDILKKNNIEIQNNSYLSASSGTNMTQYQNSWRKIVHQKISSN